MPWNGLGLYVLDPTFSPEINGTIVDAVRYNGLTTDIADGISQALAKNGENTPTSNLRMGGYKHTGAAPATAAGQYVTYEQAASLGIIDPDGIAYLARPNVFTKGQQVTPVALTSATTVTIDAETGNHFTILLAHNVNFANPTNLRDGEIINILLKQAATGNKTITFGSMFKFIGGTAPTMTPTANSYDIFAGQYYAAYGIIVCNYGNNFA